MPSIFSLFNLDGGIDWGKVYFEIIMPAIYGAFIIYHLLRARWRRQHPKRKRADLAPISPAAKSGDAGE